MLQRRRAAIAVLLVAWGCSGCRQSPSDVYVNLDKAILPSASAPTSVERPATPKLPQREEAFNIPAVPARTESRLTSAGTQRVQLSIAANRARTYQLILRRLKDTYAREAEALRDREVASFAPKRAAIYAKAMKDISNAYVTYANAVGPKIAKLAVTAGFPDPDPHGRRVPNGLEGLDKYTFEMSQKLRSDIATLKDNFKRYSETTLRAAGSDADAKLSELLADVARQVGDIDAKATEVAGREVSQAQAELGPLLADRPSPMLPAIPETRIIVASGEANPVKANLGPGNEIQIGDDPARARQDLAIWLAVNRFVLRKRGHGRDATSEFIAWRKRFRQEPSEPH